MFPVSQIHHLGLSCQPKFLSEVKSEKDFKTSFFSKYTKPAGPVNPVDL